MARLLSYNEEMPHAALGDIPPAVFKRLVAVEILFSRFAHDWKFTNGQTMSRYRISSHLASMRWPFGVQSRAASRTSALDVLLGAHLLKSGTINLARLHSLHEEGVHAAELASPLVDHSGAAAMLPSQVRDGHAGLVLLQDDHDFAAGESRLPNKTLLMSSSCNALIQSPVNNSGDSDAR